MTRTPMSTITRPTTRMAYWANAINVPADRLASGSSASSPRASPEASCHDEVGAPPLAFFLDSGCATAPSLLVLTTDHAPAAVADAAGATGSAGGIGSAGRGAGVQAGSLGDGIGVGWGAGRNGSGGSARAGSGGLAEMVGAGAGGVGGSHGGGAAGALCAGCVNGGRRGGGAGAGVGGWLPE